MPFALDRYWRLLAAYLAPNRGRLALLAALVVAATALQLAGPQLIGRFLDAATAGGGATLGLALAYIAAAVGQRAANLGAVYLGENLGWRATNSLRVDLTRHVLGLDLGFHKAHTPGELIERLDGDVTGLANFFSQFSVFVVANALLVLGILGALWWQDWRVGLGLSVYALLCLGVLAGVQGVGQRRWERVNAASARTLGFLEERLQGTEDLRASGAEAHTLAQYDALLTATMDATRSARLAGNVSYAATTFLTTAGYAAGLALAAAIYLAGAATIGQAYLIVAYVGMLAGPLDRLRAQADDLQRAGASVGRIAALFAERPLVQERVRAELPAGPLSVAFEGVTFAYDDLPVVHDLALTLRPGELLGLLGRTGSGKSTLGRLLLRLYDPQAGAIRLGGHDLRDLALGDLRGRVGVVTQEVQLFQATVRENLTLFDPALDDGRLEAALRALGIWEWACALPQGLDTPLGGGGHGLSAGEAQLLAFARVLLRDPGLIILDEASSRLDPATERLLERAIERLLAGRTAIIIAHRLGTVARADSIAILEGGRLVEHGPRAELAADPASRFARLLRARNAELLA
jgi:ATP-binding cassette, subfamily B, bacterial